MTANELSTQVAASNRRNLLMGIALSLAAMVMWLITYGFFFIVLLIVCIHWLRWLTWQTAVWIPVGICVLMLAQAWWLNRRQAKSLEYLKGDDVRDYAADGFTGTEQEYAMRIGLMHRFGLVDPFRAASGITMVFMIAPFCTLDAIRRFSMIRTPPRDVMELTAEIVEDLRGRGWMPIERYSDHAASLQLLDRLGLIWQDVQDGELCVRVAPSDGQ